MFEGFKRKSTESHQRAREDLERSLQNLEIAKRKNAYQQWRLKDLLPDILEKDSLERGVELAEAKAKLADAKFNAGQISEENLEEEKQTLEEKRRELEEISKQISEKEEQKIAELGLDSSSIDRS